MQQGQYEWDPLLTAQEVADRVRIHVNTFLLWCREGRGPREVRLGRVKRYAESDVVRWIEQRQSDADEEVA